MVATLCFGETSVGAFLETPVTASGQIAPSSPEAIGGNYDASAYDASGYAVAPSTGVAGEDVLLLGRGTPDVLKPMADKIGARVIDTPLRGKYLYKHFYREMIS